MILGTKTAKFTLFSKKSSLFSIPEALSINMWLRLLCVFEIQDLIQVLSESSKVVLNVSDSINNKHRKQDKQFFMANLNLEETTVLLNFVKCFFFKKGQILDKRLTNRKQKKKRKKKKRQKKKRQKKKEKKTKGKRKKTRKKTKEKKEKKTKDKSQKEKKGRKKDKKIKDRQTKRKKRETYKKKKTDIIKQELLL